MTDVKSKMDRTKFIFIYLTIGLSFLGHGQEIGNYVNNGSFEDLYSCSQPNWLIKAKYWRSIDSISLTPLILSTCPGLSNAPSNTYTYQWPRTGETYVGATLFYPPPWGPPYGSRLYLRNRLKSSLQAGKTYCVKFYVNITNSSTVGVDRYGAYFSDNSIDTITKTSVPLTYLIPQVENPAHNVITDTLNWVLVSGTFVANGTEKHLIIGNFRSDTLTDTTITNPALLPAVFADVCFDDVSCVETNLVAYAGSDKSCIPGDSVFIGRNPDFAIDSGCVWYKLPNMATAIDTISGLWVKPVLTSTYVVRQELDCSPLKWDTVVVFIDAVGIQDLNWYSDNITLFPNPTADNITITISCANPDIRDFCILNNLGQTIREGDLVLINKSITLQTSDLDPGIYQVHFKTSAGTVTKQFVKINGQTDTDKD